MISKLEIQNYRTCLKTSFSPHKKLSVLIGPNGAGKTNLLHGIALLKQLATEAPVGRRHQGLSTVASRITVHFDLPAGPVRLVADVKSFTDENNHDVIVDSRQRWYFPGTAQPRQALTLPLVVALFQGRPQQDSLFMHDVVYWSYRNREALETIPPEAWSAARRVAEFLSRLQYYSASQFTNPARSAVSFEIEEGDASPRRQRAGAHSAFLGDLYRQFKQPENAAYAQFLDLVGPRGLHLVDGISFQEIPTSSINYSVQVGGRVEEHTRSKVLIIPQLTIGKQTLSPNQLSEGTYRTLALVFYVTTQPCSLMLLEEPEVCVHHGLLNSILEIVKSHSRDKQIILSSHSEFVLDHMKPENVFSVSFRSDRGTKVRGIAASLSGNAMEALRKYLATEGNLGEYWRSGGLDE